MPVRIARGLAGLASLLLVTSSIASPAAEALPPTSKNVVYDDLYMHAECAASGAGGVYTVTGQVSTKLPYSSATIDCLLNGQPAIASVPTPNGIVGSISPVPLPGPAASTAGVAVAVGNDVTLCLVADATVAPPLVPPVHDHAERCS